MNIDWNKVTRVALAMVTIALLCVSAYVLFLSNLYYEQQVTLTAKDAELLESRVAIGLSESKLVKGARLERDLRTRIKNMEDEFQKLIDAHKLKIKSKDELIARLENKIEGGTTTVIVHNGPDSGTDGSVSGNCNDDSQCKAPQDFKISYSWEDPYHRFRLVDPNIWEEQNEIFTSQQFYKVEGFIFESKEGQLQTRKVELKEVDKDGNSIPGSTTTVVSANFTYTNRTVENRKPGLLDMLTLRPFALFDSSLRTGVGLEVVNLGEYIPYANIGIGPIASFDLSDLRNGSLRHSNIGVGIQYHLLPPFLETNFALGLSAGVPVDDITSPTFTVYLTFYLTPDLNILSFWKDRPEFFGIKL